MIQIRFPNDESKRQALGRLAGRFAFKSWATGEMLVPEDALPFLAVQGVSFTVEGLATDEQNGSVLRHVGSTSTLPVGIGPDFYDTAAFRDALLGHFQLARSAAIREQSCPAS